MPFGVGKDDDDRYREESGRDGRSTSDLAGRRIQELIDAAERAAIEILDDAKARARRQIDESKERADRLAMNRVRDVHKLTDALVDRAATVKEQSDTLVRALDEAIRGVQDSDGRPSDTSRDPGSRDSDLEPASREESAAMRAVREAQRRLRDIAGLQRERDPLEEPLEEPRDEAREEPRDDAREEPLEDERAARWSKLQKSRADAPRRRKGSRRGRSAPSDGARLLATQMAVSGSDRDQIETRLRQEFGVEDAAEIVDGILGSEYE